MSERTEHKNQSSQQVSGENSRFKRRRITKQQALKEGKQQWKCEVAGCSKRYLSFPALYTHVKNKHEGLTITSKNGKQANDRSPVKKMKSILKEASDNQTEKVERQLILITQAICLDLYQILLTKCNYSQKELIKTKRNAQALQSVKEEGLKRIIELNFPSDIMQTDQVFKQVKGRVFPICFGNDILRIFVSNSIGSKMFLQLLSLNMCREEGALQKFLRIEEQIWGRTLGLTCLFQNWKKWQQLVKVLEGLNQDEMQVKREYDSRTY